MGKIDLYYWILYKPGFEQKTSIYRAEGALSSKSCVTKTFFIRFHESIDGQDCAKIAMFDFVPFHRISEHIDELHASFGLNRDLWE